MTETITFQIDGQEIRARLGQTILEAADAGGTYIPRLCHRPGLEPFGGCRVCTVRVNGRPVAACTQPAVAGIVVESETEEVVGWRKAIIEMLFVEGNHFCMVCERSGECELQALAYKLGISAPRYPFLWPKRGVDASHPDVLIDHNRCVLCARCQRTSREIDGKNVFGFLGRGPDKRLAPNGGGTLDTSGLESTDHAIDACPVGAILRKHGAFDTPVGERRFDKEPIGTHPPAAPRPAAGPGEML